MTEEVSNDVELSSWLLCAPLNRAIRQHPGLFCSPLYWTQRQWSILRVQLLHAHDAERRSTINSKPFASIRVPEISISVRRYVNQLECSSFLPERLPQRVAAMRGLLNGWEGIESGNRLEIHDEKLPLLYGNQATYFLPAIGTYSFSDSGGEWELAHVDGSHLAQARRKRPMRSRHRILGDESQGRDSLFFIPGLLIAMAQSHQYRQQLEPAEQTDSARTKRSQFCVLLTDCRVDNSSVHLYTTSYPDALIKLLQAPEKPLQLETPWPSHMPFLTIEHMPIPYQPFTTFRSRLRDAIFQTQDDEGARKREQSQATESPLGPNKRPCTLDHSREPLEAKAPNERT
ncbi:hypothetical protein F5Y10DRAFT_233973 [Nemania abortiva]|nr:hypothetical protein F5Y10DRAFT_233973 [Nemania abortiva]